MKPQFVYDAVIFDMDGLMLDTERIGFEGFCYAYHLQGFNGREDFFKTLIGTNVKDANAAMLKIFGPDFPIDQIRKDRQVYVSKVKKESGIPVKKGLHTLLRYLKKRRIPLAIASSSSREVVHENLTSVGVAGYFSMYLCGDEITHGKPHPEIYLNTAKKLKLNPKKIIVMEDSFPGITAAHAAGMIPFMVPDMHVPTDSIRQKAYRVFDSLEEVKTYLEELDAEKL